MRSLDVRNCTAVMEHNQATQEVYTTTDCAHDATTYLHVLHFALPYAMLLQQGIGREGNFDVCNDCTHQVMPPTPGRTSFPFPNVHLRNFETKKSEDG